MQIMHMQVMQQSPSQLTLRLRPVLIWVFGSIFTVAGVFTIFSGKVITFTCHRTELPQSICRLSTSGLLGLKIREIPVNTLQGAKVENDEVVLLTNNGEVPFNSDSSADASRINQFVRTPEQKTLTVQQDNRLLLYLFGGVFTASSLFILVFGSQVVTCVFDKMLGTFTLRRQGLFGREITEHQIGEIVDVRVEEQTDSDGSTYLICIIMRSGECLPLTRYSSSGKRGHQETADCLRRFLKLNHQISG